MISSMLLVGCGTFQSGTAAPTSSATEPALNAEAQTAAALEANPTAAATQQSEVATAQAANTAVTTGSGASVPACVVRPEVTEGPYYVDVDLLRADIRTDTTTGEARPGAPLTLTFNVSQVSSESCAPLEGASVEIWHCDAQGQYSGVSDPGFDTSNQT